MSGSGKPPVRHVDAIVVGAGFAGLCLLYRLRGLGLSVRVFETGAGVGGTWFWNCYPGARCDVESLQYSFSFSEELQQEWEWTERYASQPEIQRYLDHVADRFDMRRDISLETTVTAAIYDEQANLWRVETDRGDVFEARFCIMATGCLSAARVPDIKGLDRFGGQWFHTGRWPKQPVSFRGKRVAVIGTGSSGIQAIPMIAAEADHLFVLQRTPNFSIPAWNAPLPVERQNEWKENYEEHRRAARNSRSGILYEYAQRGTFEVDEDERRREYERRWATGGANFTHCFNDIFFDRSANDLAAEFVREKIREIVKDPKVAEMLTPTDHAIGTKRICVDTDYYKTFNRENVTLVDLRQAPIEEITETGIRTAAAHYDLDAIVFATGYDAVTGALLKIDIRGRDGLKLADKWHGGPRSYLGLMMAGFPNLFVITGPGSPSILTNVVVSIEQHVDWVARCIDHMRAGGAERIEPTEEAEDAWVREVGEVASKTLFTGTNSWYMGANIPGKPRVFLPYVGGFGKYSQICETVAAEGYRGFQLA
ncbi:flavin-containing monooxygenase [Propylenella binzhouense]|uniref:NAD(P)/FAD-dependent oxidoreductase n=1 Tax=Propylenella binzhouense TaxID=2555902 RepID=A0A964WSE9_9HYPH|nr:NAD(P)/FAD-dependent oxidoreductase [Propylenella binzhouense]MYZ46908.1 NAD(P)/FAD-dependent oxidoreductase [Propylenella binzhouense]